MMDLRIDGKLITSLTNDQLGATLEQIAEEMIRRREPNLITVAGTVSKIGSMVRRVKDK